MMQRLTFLGTCFALWVMSPAVYAQEPSSIDEARLAFDAGREAYEAGRFEEALTSFNRAYELTEAADILYNIATVADRLRRDEVALDAYRRYLEARPDSADRAQIEARIAILEGQIRDSDAQATAASEREARLREALEQRPTQVQVASDPGPAPWIVLGIGGAAVVAGLVLVVVAEADAACVRDGCTDRSDGPRWEDVADAYDRIPTLQGVGGALIGAGAAAAGIGLIWALTSAGDTPTSTVQLGPGSVSLRGSFK